MTLSVRSQTEKARIVQFQLLEIYRTGKSIDRKHTVGCWGLVGKRGKGKWLYNEVWISFWDDGMFSISTGDGRRTFYVVSKSLNVHLWKGEFYDMCIYITLEIIMSKCDFYKRTSKTHDPELFVYWLVLTLTLLSSVDMKKDLTLHWLKPMQKRFLVATKKVVMWGSWRFQTGSGAAHMTA